MKAKLQFTSVLFAICTLAQAQTSQLEYRPFAVGEKVWETQIGGIKENLYCYKIDGDTILNGETWKKVYSYISWSHFNYNYFAAVRDVGNKVYAIAKGSSKPRLLYNFDLKVGNTVNCGIEGANFGCLLDAGEKPDTLFGFPFKYSLRVEKIDTIKYSYNGMEFRRFTLKLVDAYNLRVHGIDNIVWIEGIGSGAGVFSPWQQLPRKGSFQQTCIENRAFIFGEELYYQEENPSVVGSPQAAKKKSSAIYDMDGRQLPQTPQKGIYIQDGHKVAVK